MLVQLMTFTTCFGNKAENQNLILAFSLTDGNIAIFVVKRVRVPKKHYEVLYNVF